MNLVETLSGVAVRALPAAQLRWLRNGYRALRQRAAPLMRAIHRPFDAAQLQAHLRERLGPFEVLMVHCSVNNLQPMYTGGVADLLKALTELVGPERTLAMPAFYFGDPRDPSTAATFQRQPRFDLRRVPSQMGLLSEMFRRSRGVLCSRHPIYRVCALGPHAAELLRGHELADYPCGRSSPFDAMVARDTLIIGIGKPFEVLTQVHHAEDVLLESFPVPATPVAPVAMTLVDGDEQIAYTLRGRTLQWKRDMWRLRGLMPAGTLLEWRFHGVPMFATRAADVTRALTQAAAAGRTLYVAP